MPGYPLMDGKLQPAIRLQPTGKSLWGVSDMAPCRAYQSARYTNYFINIFIRTPLNSPPRPPTACPPTRRSPSTTHRPTVDRQLYDVFAKVNRLILHANLLFVIYYIKLYYMIIISHILHYILLLQISRAPPRR